MPNWAWWLIIVVGGSIIMRWIFRAIEEAQAAKEERIAQRVAEKLRGEDNEYDWTTPVESEQERKDREAEEAFEAKIEELGKDNWRFRK